MNLRVSAMRKKKKTLLSSTLTTRAMNYKQNNSRNNYNDNYNRKM